MSKIIEHLTDQDFLTSKDGVQHVNLGGRINNIEKEIKPLKVRYIRDWVNGSSTNIHNHWVEIQAFNENGENVAHRKPVTASGIEETDSIPIDLITDGSSATRPFKGYRGGNGACNVVVDLGESYDITHVTLWHFYEDSRTYYETKTEVSEDGINWIVIYDSSIEGLYQETAEGKTIKVSLNTQIKKNIKEIQDIKNRLEGLKSFYNVSLLEMDYELTKEKLTYYLATYGLGE